MNSQFKKAMVTVTRTPECLDSRLPVSRLAGTYQCSNPLFFNRPTLRKGERSISSVPGNKPLKGSTFCVTSIYAEWHIGITSSSNFVASLASVVVTICFLDSISKMACQI